MKPICDLCKCEIDGVHRKYYTVGPLRYTGEWATLCKSCHDLFGSDKAQKYRIEKIGPLTPWEAEAFGSPYTHIKTKVLKGEKW